MGADWESLLAAMMLLGSSGFLLSQLQPHTAPSTPRLPAPIAIDPQLQQPNSLPQIQKAKMQLPAYLDRAVDRLIVSDSAGQPELARIELVLHLANRGSGLGEWESGEGL